MPCATRWPKRPSTSAAARALTRLASFLDVQFGVKEDDFKAIDTRVKKVVNDAAAFAEASPLPPTSELLTDIMPE